ncbi:MAG: chorismate-binding protein, partial [Planctomycetota bacterium]
PYCGSLFHLIPGLQPQARFSVLIRTARVGDGELVLPVGAGIVWDSDPAREWEETLLKGRYLEGP